MRSFRSGTDGSLNPRNLVRAGLWIALLLSVTFTATSQTPNQATPPMPGTLVDVGGYRVHLYCTGRGSPTVMIVGAFSFDWALVQPEVAKFTRVCTFDPSGTAWSDRWEAGGKAGAPSCRDRVNEIHQLITRAHLDGPPVVVGYSVGALWARLLAAEYPDDLAGMVLVDHAFVGDSDPPQKVQAKTLQGYHPPALITDAPMNFGFEDDANFTQLPKHDQELHAWALSENPVRPNYEMAVDCFSDLKTIAGSQRFPLGDMRLFVISTDNETAGYLKLQTELLGLSRRSEHVIAWNSTHMVPIDAPEVIIESIHKVVSSER